MDGKKNWGTVLRFYTRMSGPWKFLFQSQERDNCYDQLMEIMGKAWRGHRVFRFGTKNEGILNPASSLPTLPALLAPSLCPSHLTVTVRSLASPGKGSHQCIPQDFRISWPQSLPSSFQGVNVSGLTSLNSYFCYIEKWISIVTEHRPLEIARLDSVPAPQLLSFNHLALKMIILIVPAP